MHYPLKTEVIVPLRCPPSHRAPPTHEWTLSLHAWPPWSPRPEYIVKKTMPGRTWTWHLLLRLALHSPGSRLGSTASSAYEHQGHDPHIPTNAVLGASRQPQAHPACQGSPDECKCLAVEVISTPLHHLELATIHDEWGSRCNWPDISDAPCGQCPWRTLRPTRHLQSLVMMIRVLTLTMPAARMLALMVLALVAHTLMLTARALVLVEVVALMLMLASHALVSHVVGVPCISIPCVNIPCVNVPCVGADGWYGGTDIPYVCAGSPCGGTGGPYTGTGGPTMGVSTPLGTHPQPVQINGVSSWGWARATCCKNWRLLKRTKNKRGKNKAKKHAKTATRHHTLHTTHSVKQSTFLKPHTLTK